MSGTTHRRQSRRKGSELIEFSLVMIPFFAILFVTLDLCWIMFAQGSMQYAVRRGVRYAVTNRVPKGSNLTDEVKKVVQKESLGMLYGKSGLDKIEVHFYKVNSATGALTDATADPKGNTGGNIVEVSVNNYSLAALFPRWFYSGAEAKPSLFSVSSADRIEPIRESDLPPVAGKAP